MPRDRHLKERGSKSYQWGTVEDPLTQVSGSWPSGNTAPLLSALPSVWVFSTGVGKMSGYMKLHHFQFWQTIHFLIEKMGKLETVADFILGGSKITSDGDYSMQATKNALQTIACGTKKTLHTCKES